MVAMCNLYDLFSVYKSFEELAEDYKQGKMHPNDLKPAVAKVINELIEPVRRHFETDPEAKALISKIKSFKREAEAEVKHEAGEQPA